MCTRKVMSQKYVIDQVYLPRKDKDDDYADRVIGQYRMCISKHIHDPGVRSNAFPLRNNILTPG